MPKRKKARGRPPKYLSPERIDASPEEIARVVLRAKPKTRAYVHAAVRLDLVDNCIQFPK